MDERVVQFRVGVMVLASIIITAILVLLFGHFPALVRGTYTLHIHFLQAPGVVQDTPVRKFGIRIGHVSQVGFAEDEAGAEVTVEINSDVRLRTDEVCRIQNSLLGDAVLEFIDGDPDHTPDEYFKDGDWVVGVQQSDPLQVISNLEGNLAQAIGSVGRTSEEIGVLARRVGDVLEANEEQIARIVDKSEQTIDRLRATIESTDEILSDPVVKENLRRAIADLPKVLDEARDTIGGLRNTLSGVDRNLANLEGLTRPLGERGGQLVENVERATARLDQVLTQLSTFSDSLTDPRGSLGQLLSNPDVYQQINSAATNINELTRELGPIVRDVRTFSDKIARHPELLGVRGAIRPGSGIKRAPSELMNHDPEVKRTSHLRWGVGH
ncbi:MAG: MlaD family protein [Pirellulales bacterium]